MVGTHICADKCAPYLSPGRSLTEAEISAASGHSFSTSSRGPHRDLLKPRKDFLTESKKEGRDSYTPRWKKSKQLVNICVLAPPLTFEAMLEAVLHYDKELLQRRVVRVQRASEAQSRLNQTFDAKLGHVQQVGALHCHGVSQGCGEEGHTNTEWCAKKMVRIKQYQINQNKKLCCSFLIIALLPPLQKEIDNLDLMSKLQTNPVIKIYWEIHS